MFIVHNSVMLFVNKYVTLDFSCFFVNFKQHNSNQQKMLAHASQLLFPYCSHFCCFCWWNKSCKISSYMSSGECTHYCTITNLLYDNETNAVNLHMLVTLTFFLWMDESYFQNFKKTEQSGASCRHGKLQQLNLNRFYLQINHIISLKLLCTDIVQVVSQVYLLIFFLLLHYFI